MRKAGGGGLARFSAGLQSLAVDPVDHDIYIYRCI